MEQRPGGCNIVEALKATPDSLDARRAITPPSKKATELGDPADRLA